MKDIESKYLIIPIVFAIVLFLTPIALTVTQKIVVIIMATTIFWWATGGINTTYAAIFMIVGFLLFSGAHPLAILNFPLSPTFILIFASFLLAMGITNTRAAEQLAEIILRRFGTNAISLIVLAFVLGVILIFLIPHPFPRLIILGSIYNVFLNQYDISKKAKSVIMISVFIAGTTTPTLFLNGDFILNYSALEFANVSLSFSQWALTMTLPGILMNVFVCLIVLALFRKNITSEKLKLSGEIKALKLNPERKKAFIIMGLVVIMWALESLHGIPSAVIAVIGVILMFATKILKLKNFKDINYGLLIYLTATFSIGKVLKVSGISAYLQELLTDFVPQSQSLGLYLFIIISVMVFHMLLGTCLTTMSVVIPLLTTLLGGMVSPVVIAMIAYMTVSIHYILPYQHLAVVIGIGENYYSEAQLRSFGLIMAPITILIILLLYIPWWNLIGLL